MTAQQRIDDSGVQLAHGPAWANRYVLAPTTNKQSHDDGTLSETEYQWLVARGRGGFAVVKTCAAYIADSGRTWTGQLGIASDRHLPGLTRLAQGLQATGTRSLVQLHHGGLRANSSLAGRLLAPFADPESGTVAMDTSDVQQMVEHYVAAAVRAEQAGFDGVEVHGAHGFLLAQFLDRRNQRSDAFTGLPRGDTVLSVTGHVLSAVDAAWCLTKGADVIGIGVGAILHHDFAHRALADPNFKARPQPVSRDVLRAELVGPAFIDYLAADWDDLVA